MSNFWFVIIVSAVSGILGTGLGGFLGTIFKKDNSKIVSFLLSFAGGVMMAIVCFELIPEAIMPEGAETETPLYIVVLGIVLGFVAVCLLNMIIDNHANKEVVHIDKHHPKTADNLDELIHSDHYTVHLKRHKTGVARKYELFIAGIIMAGALALHNLPEGMVIGASYSGYSGNLFSGGGFIIAVVLGLHNIPEGMAISVPLIAGGTSKFKAMLLSALAGVPTVLGAILGYTLGLLSPIWLALSLTFAAGAMLYAVFGELIPEAILIYKSKLPALAILVGFLVGIVLVNI
ncbi:MAG: ZIP family metal transporter [Clostridia bacterium]|nr:ZIP family metal transporter [Clostridia bacterium]